MRKIKLTEAQKARIIERLSEYHDGNHDFEFEEDFEDEGLIVNVKGWVETSEHQEDDYESGTGGWVEDYRNANVRLTGWLTKAEEEVEIDDNGEAMKYMNAA